jgi:hypothetical protein
MRDLCPSPGLYDLEPFALSVRDHRTDHPMELPGLDLFRDLAIDAYVKRRPPIPMQGIATGRDHIAWVYEPPEVEPLAARTITDTDSGALEPMRLEFFRELLERFHECSKQR